MAVALRWRREPVVGRAAGGLGALALVQFGLGALAVLRLPADPVFWGTAHQFGALALLAAAVVALFRARHPAAAQGSHRRGAEGAETAAGPRADPSI